MSVTKHGGYAHAIKVWRGPKSVNIRLSAEEAIKLADAIVKLAKLGHAHLDLAAHTNEERLRKADGWTQVTVNSSAPPNPWARWATDRATWYVVTSHAGGDFWQAINPDLAKEGLPGAERMLFASNLPPSVLPLEVGQPLGVTMRRVDNPGGIPHWVEYWSPIRLDAPKAAPAA